MLCKVWLLGAGDFNDGLGFFDMGTSGSERMKSRKSCLMVFATLLSISASVAASETVVYVYTDVQGTPLASTDAQGNLSKANDYRPYGMTSLGEIADGPGYTGHTNDADTGFVYMQARYYDPEIGRFINTDPVRIRPGSIADFNDFQYASDNTFAYIDPSGAQVCGVFACETYNSGWNDGSITSRGEANYRISQNFRHYTDYFATGQDSQVRSSMPSATREALIQILLTPTGGMLSGYMNTTGGKIDLIQVSAMEGFGVIGENTVTYTTSVGAEIWEHAGSLLEGDQIETATLAVLLSHEFGHTALGAASVGSRRIDVINRTAQGNEERRAVKSWENPVRSSMGLPRRCSYMVSFDICR